MRRQFTILAVPAAFVVAIVGACSGDLDEDPAGAERVPEAETVPEAGTFREAEPTPPATPPASEQADAFGRPPGDPHHGHNHPPADPPPSNAPAAGEPDAFGRQPGDPHYGQDHP